MLEVFPEDIGGLAEGVHEGVGAQEQRESTVDGCVPDGVCGAAACVAAHGDVDKARHECETQRESVPRTPHRCPPHDPSAGSTAPRGTRGRDEGGEGTEDACGDVVERACRDCAGEQEELAGGVHDVVRAVAARGCIRRHGPRCHKLCMKRGSVCLKGGGKRGKQTRRARVERAQKREARACEGG